MIDGVTILNQFEVATEKVFSWPAFWAGVILGILVGVFAAIIFAATENDFDAFIFSLPIFCVCFALLFGLLAGFVICPEVTAYETHYEVSVSPIVNFEEFMSLYDIVETRGNIYTIRIK